MARTPADAHALVPHLLELTDDIVEVRAQLTEAAHAVPARPLADTKGLQAHLADLLDRLGDLDVQVKGWAPLLVDIPVQVQGREVLFCWLEGDRRLGWYHEVEHGFPGRRPLAHLDL